MKEISLGIRKSNSYKIGKGVKMGFYEGEKIEEQLGFECLMILFSFDFSQNKK